MQNKKSNGTSPQNDFFSHKAQKEAAASVVVVHLEINHQVQVQVLAVIVRLVPFWEKGSIFAILHLVM